MGVIEERREKSEKRLRQYIERVQPLAELQGLNDLCIYVTGSYGRLEASKHSDLDLFFVCLGSDADERQRIPRLRKVPLDAALIRVSRELGFPDFSNDGEFLQIHYLDDIKATLGSREDDYKNYFTARMLLLLESRPIYGDDTFNKIVNGVVETYFRDYEGHAEAFRPVFLLNDIARFWKTLCLNYENKRKEGAENADEKAKSAIRNLKLKFSRLMTCYSTAAVLVARDAITDEEIVQVVQQTPLDRLERFKEHHRGRDSLAQIREQYDWFLGAMDKPSAEQREWVKDPDQKKLAFERAERFGEAFYRLLTSVGTDKALRYLVV